MFSTQTEYSAILYYVYVQFNRNSGPGFKGAAPVFFGHKYYTVKYSLLIFFLQTLQVIKECRLRDRVRIPRFFNCNNERQDILRDFSWSDNHEISLTLNDAKDIKYNHTTSWFTIQGLKISWIPDFLLSQILLHTAGFIKPVPSVYTL